MKTRRMIYWWFWFVVSGRFLERFLNLRYDAFMARALDNAATRWTGRRPDTLQASDFSGADEFFTIGRAAGQDIASLPGQIGEAPGQGLIAAQPARSQNMADVWGKSAHLGFHQDGDRCS